MCYSSDQSRNCFSDETIAVTVLRPRPEASAIWRIEAPARCATRIMSSRIPNFLGCPLCAETHHHQSSAGLALFTTPVLVHRGSRREDVGVAVTHLSSLSPRAILSRIAINSATRGDISALASASLRWANVIPRSSSASIRSSSTLITGPIVAVGGSERTSTYSLRDGGWPSFTVPWSRPTSREKTDRSFGMIRNQVRPRHGKSDVGHVFDDGPSQEGLTHMPSRS